MYKCCYYGYGTMMTEQGIASYITYNRKYGNNNNNNTTTTNTGKPGGYDRVRNVEIGNKNFDLKHLEEAFTSEHWLVRIYRVLPDDNRS